jgi:hypothetical protein
MKTENNATQFDIKVKPARFAVLAVIALTILIIGLTGAEAQAPAGAKRPAAVPADFVVTPFGYFHPSCVNHLAKGDNLREDEKTIEHKDGTSRSIPVCGYPHFEADGTKVVGNIQRAADRTKEPYIGHSWIEYASITTSSAYGQIYAEWEVPGNPANDDGQIVFLFNGLEDDKGDVTIIQPVLGWNNDYTNAWSIAAWNCCVNGEVNEATPAPANPGDHLEGYVFNNCNGGTKVCNSWDIVIVDEENGNVSQLIDTTNYGQTFNWAFGGVLEVYSITQCGDYPPADYAGGIGFHNESVLNDEFIDVATPGWKVYNVSSGLSPQCNYGGSTPKQITLTY